MKRTSNLSSCGLQTGGDLGINIHSFGPSSWELISANHQVECWEVKIKQMWTLSSGLAGLRKIHELSKKCQMWRVVDFDINDFISYF